MFITNIQTGITEDYRKIFPNTSFPTEGPSNIWLEKKGFKSAQNSNEILEEEIRETRNKLLEQSDWIVISAYEKGENPQTVYPKWIAYRQALRDITEQEGFPQTVQWPISPV